MTMQAALEVFAQAIAQAATADEAAKLELVREYLTNDAFRANLQQATWEAAQ
jgi:hypothetical protein